MRHTLPNCCECGKWVGWKKGYMTFTPFGSVLDMEPPDPQFMHLSCWEKLDEKHRSYFTKWAWCPAQIIKPGESQGEVF